MQTKPNVIFIITDQQRHDTLGATGSTGMVTPSLDRLAQQSVTFSRAFSCAAACVASRASLFSGLRAHNTGIYGNQYPWGHLRTWLHDFRESGYYVANVGKMHHGQSQMAFHERFIVENKSSQLKYDEWNRYLWMEGKDVPERQNTISDWSGRLNADVWPFDEKYYSDVFVGNMAVNFIDRWDHRKPLFLEIGFPGPHEPYDPPDRFLQMYGESPMGKPIGRPNELRDKPPYQKALQDYFASSPNENRTDMGGASPEAIARMRRHYCASVTAIDEKIGQIMDALERKGMLEDSIIVFTSDHGDHLGDHGLPYKWTMYDSIVRVPLIVKTPHSNNGGGVDDQLFSHIDIGPTLLRLAGIPIPPYLDGSERAGRLSGETEGNVPAFVAAEENFVTMLRTDTHKLVYSVDHQQCELYDLTEDPDELWNKYNDVEYESVRNALKEQVLRMLIGSNHRFSDCREDFAGATKVRLSTMIG